jgi:hypothetical protein
MSKYWITMNTSMDAADDSKTIISLEPSPAAQLPDDYKISFDIKNDIPTFLKYNNITSSGNIVLLPETLYKKFLDKSNICACSILSGDKIVAVCISLIIPINVERIQRNQLKISDTSLENYHPNKKTVLFGYTNFLCSNTETREKSLAINSVRATLEYGYKFGVQFGYYLTTKPITATALKISPWFRPINSKNAIAAGFKITESKHNHLIYSNNLPNDYSYALATASDLKHYNKFIGSKKIYWNPSKEYWNLYLSIFNVIIIKYKDEIVGLASIVTTAINMSSTNKIINTGVLMWCVGISEHLSKTLKCVCNYCNDNKINVLYGYTIGDVTTEIHSSINSFNTPEMYLEFYNTNIKYTMSEILLPLY